jgi:hypothetical protein
MNIKWSFKMKMTILYEKTVLTKIFSQNTKFFNQNRKTFFQNFSEFLILIRTCTNFFITAFPAIFQWNRHQDKVPVPAQDLH